MNPESVGDQVRISDSPPRGRSSCHMLIPDANTRISDSCHSTEDGQSLPETRAIQATNVPSSNLLPQDAITRKRLVDVLAAMVLNYLQEQKAPPQSQKLDKEERDENIIKNEKCGRPRC